VQRLRKDAPIMLESPGNGIYHTLDVIAVQATVSLTCLARPQRYALRK
jgi:hypothetical protein